MRYLTSMFMMQTINFVKSVHHIVIHVIWLNVFNATQIMFSVMITNHVLNSLVNPTSTWIFTQIHVKIVGHMTTIVILVIKYSAYHVFKGLIYFLMIRILFVRVKNFANLLLMTMILVWCVFNKLRTCILARFVAMIIQ